MGKNISEKLRSTSQMIPDELACYPEFKLEDNAEYYYGNISGMKATATLQVQENLDCDRIGFMQIGLECKRQSTYEVYYNVVRYLQDMRDGLVSDDPGDGYYSKEGVKQPGNKINFSDQPNFSPEKYIIKNGLQRKLIGVRMTEKFKLMLVAEFSNIYFRYWQKIWGYDVLYEKINGNWEKTISRPISHTELIYNPPVAITPPSGTMLTQVGEEADESLFIYPDMRG